MKNKILKEFDNLEICDMTRAEAELHSIRTSIESYKMILKTNKELTPELAFKLGRYGGYVLAHNKGEKHPKVLVGRDTRVSGEMLESALIAGLISIGAEVMRLGVISTPGVAYLTREMEAELGVMISASHNPVPDNGIKFFGSDGFKLSDNQEQEIEKLLDQENPDLPRPVGEDIVHCSDYFEGAQKYISYLKSTVDVNLWNEDCIRWCKWFYIFFSTIFIR